jgi:zona occludens toxin (predicted ATPase)
MQKKNLPGEIPFFLTLFILVMAATTWIAYSRPSGRTGQDPVKIDLVRKSDTEKVELARMSDPSI